MNSIFDQIDFGPINEFLEDEDITDISYSNGGQVWLKSLTKGVFKVERPEINNTLMEKVAFQCANTMGKTFNMAHPFLDSESAELRMNFVHESIATNGIACVIRKTPAKIRLNKEKLLSEEYMTEKLHNFLEQCVLGHCNIIVSGETGSGKTELVKYLASKTKENEKIISIEDTLELHLDRIYPNRDIVAMKTNNIASYSDVLVTCMRQNPIWILLSEVRSAEAVLAVRNSISSGHHILSTIHADKASSIPMRMYSLLESSQDTDQFLSSIHRYVQIGIYVKGYFSKKLNRFQREIIEVCEFYVDDDNKPKSNILYKKTLDGQVTMNNPTRQLLDYLSIGNIYLPEDTFNLHGENPEADNPSSFAKTAEVNDMLNSGENVEQPEAEVQTVEQSSITEEAPTVEIENSAPNIEVNSFVQTPDNVMANLNSQDMNSQVEQGELTTEAPVQPQSNDFIIPIEDLTAAPENNANNEFQVLQPDLTNNTENSEIVTLEPNIGDTQNKVNDITPVSRIEPINSGTEVL